MQYVRHWTLELQFVFGFRKVNRVHSDITALKHTHKITCTLQPKIVQIGRQKHICKRAVLKTFTTTRIDSQVHRQIWSKIVKHMNHNIFLSSTDFKREMAFFLGENLPPYQRHTRGRDLMGKGKIWFYMENEKSSPRDKILYFPPMLPLNLEFKFLQLTFNHI